MAFFSQGLKEYKERYSFIEKHVLAIVRSFTKLRQILFNNKIKLLVVHPPVKEFLLSKDLNGKRVGWVT